MYPDIAHEGECAVSVKTKILKFRRHQRAHGFKSAVALSLTVQVDRIKRRVIYTCGKYFVGTRIRLYERDCLGKFFCSVCERETRFFIPISSYLLANWKTHEYQRSIFSLETFNVRLYKCPRCSATDRERFLVSFLLKDEVDRCADKTRVLDVGPKLRQIRRLRQHFGDHYVCVDRFAKHVDMNLDITHMPEVGDDQFSLIICSHVLEHVENDRAAVKEFSRILEVGGRVACLVPIDKSLVDKLEGSDTETPAERWSKYLDGDHRRLYSRRSLEDLFKSYGFSVSYFTFSDLGGPLGSKLGLAADSRIYLFKNTKGSTRSTPRSGLQAKSR